MKLIKLLLLLALSSSISLSYCDDYIHSDSDSDSDTEELAVPSTSSSKPSLADRVQNIKTRYKLFSKSSYRAGVNKSDYLNTHKDPIKDCQYCEKKHSYAGLCKLSDLYEFACMSSGYKNLIIPEDGHIRSFITALRSDKDIEHVMQNKKLHYAQLWTEGYYTYLIYSSEGRLNALRLLKKCLETQKTQCSARPTQLYLTGKCLGYPDEDLEFFWQRIFFKKKQGLYPENDKKKFDEYLKTVWSNTKGLRGEDILSVFEKLKGTGKDSLTKNEQSIVVECEQNTRLLFEGLRAGVEKWLKDNSDAQQLEKDIQQLARKNPSNDVLYDQPFDAFMNRCAPLDSKWQEAMRVIKYLLKDGLNGAWRP